MLFKKTHTISLPTQSNLAKLQGLFLDWQGPARRKGRRCHRDSGLKSIFVTQALPPSGIQAPPLRRLESFWRDWDGDCYVQGGRPGCVPRVAWNYSALQEPALAPGLSNNQLCLPLSSPSGRPPRSPPTSSFPVHSKTFKKQNWKHSGDRQAVSGGPSISSGALDKGSGPNAPRGERQHNYERVPSPGAPSGLHPTQAPARGGLRHLQPRKPPTLGRRVHGRRTPHPEPQPRPP